MISELVEAAIVAAVAQEVERRRLIGKMVHLVVGEDRIVLRAAIELGLVCRWNRLFGDRRSFKA